MRRHLQSIAIVVALLVIMAGSLAFVYHRDPERRFDWMRNNEAHCHNCSSFFRNALRSYADDHDGWFPKDGGSPLDSLAKLMAYDEHVHVFTSHKLAGALRDHYQQTGKLSEDYCCYRYNEGLRAEDDEDLIVVYYFRPTRWTSHSHKGSVLGRQVMGPSGWGWEFIPEEEFQLRQNRTLAVIEERKRRAAEIETITSTLKLSVVCTNTAPGTFMFSALVRNTSQTDSASLLLLKRGDLIDREGGSRGTSFLEHEGTEIILEPGNEYAFPGKFRLKVEDIVREGMLVSRTTRSRSFGEYQERPDDTTTYTGEGRTVFGAGVKLSDENAHCWVQASLQIRVSLGSITNLETVLKSEEYKFMELHSQADRTSERNQLENTP
jgi:hypothetical protein